MQISINWLKQYVDIKSDIKTLTDKLSMLGLEVEGYEPTGDGDYVVDIDLTPDRGDCLGMINLAREVAVIEGTRIKLPEYLLQQSLAKTEDLLQIEVREPDLCPRYAARIIKNVTIRESPEWLKNFLSAVGIRSINNVVDITNFVMLENNQPLHAFDYDLLQGTKIIVRKAQEQELFTTLDGETRHLQTSDLVISNGNEHAVALAGVMGGQDTEINNGTTSILLESACFDGINVRKTSNRLGLRTDASIRFEKNTDINAVIYVLDRAAALIQEIAGGEVLDGAVDAYPIIKEPVTINLSTCRSNKLLGVEMTSEEISDIFNRLGFPLSVTGADSMAVTVPTYRTDITMEADLIEEVGRIYGYENIPTVLPLGITTIGGLNLKQKFISQVKNSLATHMLETINYSFISAKDMENLLTLPDADIPQLVHIANPISEEHSVMRTTLLPGLLTTVKNNIARQNHNLSFFEMGAVYLLDKNQHITEPWHVAGITAGQTTANWLQQPVNMDFFYVKGVLTDLFSLLNITVAYMPARHNGYHPGRLANIVAGDSTIGMLGEIHPQVKQRFALKGNVCAFELDLEKLYSVFDPNKTLKGISKYPAIERDLAVVVPEQLLVGDMLADIKQIASGFLQTVDIFDVYTGEQVPPGQKSIALKFLWQAQNQTLKDEEVNDQMANILKWLQNKYEAQLR